MKQFEDLLRSGTYRLAPASCPCGRPAADVVVAEVDRYRLPLTSVLCLKCGTVRFDPYLDQASVERFYRELYQDLYERAVVPADYFVRQQGYGRKVLATISGKTPISVLEVGCGAGGGLSVLHEAGHFVAGCEYSSVLVEFGTRRGVPNLHVGSIQQVASRLGRDRFDLIVLHHVFEHVDRPADTLEHLTRLLTADGRLLIIVPDLRHIHDHPFPGGDALGYLHVAHPYNYSPLGLTLTARQTGLVARRVNPPAGMPTAWSHMPEMWMELTHPIGPLPNEMESGEPGRAMLRYLRRTERLYQWGICPAQLVAKMRRLSVRRLAGGVARRVRVVRKDS
jgi:SAM-dependent methyltransferase